MASRASPPASSRSRTRATWWSPCSCPTAPRSSAPRRRWIRSARSRGERPGVDQVATVAGISPLDNSASLSSAGVAYVTLKPWSERGKGQDLLSLFVGMNNAMQEVMDARVLVVPPPPIQGVGNASGATMQIELRDGSFDFRKLQSLANAMVEAGTGPVELPAHDDDVPRRRAAVPHRCRPREGADAARQCRSGVLHHPDLHGVDLCGAVQQVRPHLPGLCAGRREIPPQARGHHRPDRAQQPGPDGSDRHAGVGRADHRPAADQPLQSLSDRDRDRHSGAGRVVGPGRWS